MVGRAPYTCSVLLGRLFVVRVADLLCVFDNVVLLWILLGWSSPEKASEGGEGLQEMGVSLLSNNSGGDHDLMSRFHCGWMPISKVFDIHRA